MSNWYLGLDCSLEGQTRVLVITQQGTEIISEPVRAQEAVSVVDHAITSLHLDTKGIRGTIVATGVGSFMATRISVTAANGLAAGWNVPAVAIAPTALTDSFSWAQAETLFAGVSPDASVTAEYSAQPNIRIPKSHVV